MKNKIVSVLLFLLVLITVFTSSNSTGFNENYEDLSEVDVTPLSLLDGGWVEMRDGVKILHLNGSNYQMGFQHGFFLKEDYMICHRAWLNFLEKMNVSLDDMKEIWSVMNSSIPPEYKQEMKGRADALGLPFEDVAAMETLGVALYWRKECCGVAAWGPATVGGKLLHISSGDYSLNLKDPVTDEFAPNCQIIVVRKPDDGIASVCFALPTEVGVEGGVNEQGIVIGYTALLTDNSTVQGIPLGLRQLMVMDHAISAEEAVDIVNSNRTCGWSFIIGDGKMPIGYAVEQHADYAYAGTWDNPVERNYPSWTIDHMVRRGNLFLDPASAGINPKLYKNSTFLRWILVRFGLLNEENCYTRLKHFVVLSKTFQRHWGKLNLQNSMTLLRRFYRGWTNPVFFFLQKIFQVYGANWHQWVICPETGDILVSFSHNRLPAHIWKVHYFNMYELLNAESPIS